MAAIAPIILFRNILESSISIAVLADSLAVGFILFALIEMFDFISGAHFNPAVSFSMAILKKIEWSKAIAYMIFQVMGGLIGMIITHLMFFNDMKKLIVFSNICRSNWIYSAEVLGTFILVLCILLLSQKKSSRIALVIGLLVGGELIATSLTMFANPQVTIARIFTYSEAGIRPLDAIWFIIMEFTGALLAVITWSFLNRDVCTNNRSINK